MIMLLSFVIRENKAGDIDVRSKDKYTDKVTYLLFEVSQEKST